MKTLPQRFFETFPEAVWEARVTRRGIPVRDRLFRLSEAPPYHQILPQFVDTRYGCEYQRARRKEDPPRKDGGVVRLSFWSRKPPTARGWPPVGDFIELCELNETTVLLRGFVERNWHYGRRSSGHLILRAVTFNVNFFPHPPLPHPKPSQDVEGDLDEGAHSEDDLDEDKKDPPP